MSHGQNYNRIVPYDAATKTAPTFVRGKGWVQLPYTPRRSIPLDDDTLTALRLKHHGGVGHAKNDPNFVGGLRTIAEIVGCSWKTVSNRLRQIAEREEADA